MRVVLIRHGESEANASRTAAQEGRAKYQHSRDPPLTSLGESQAACWGELIARHRAPWGRVATVLVSPLLRTLQTCAHAFSKLLQTPHAPAFILAPAARELSWNKPECRGRLASELRSNADIPLALRESLQGWDALNAAGSCVEGVPLWDPAGEGHASNKEISRRTQVASRALVRQIAAAVTDAVPSTSGRDTGSGNGKAEEGSAWWGTHVRPL